MAAPVRDRSQTLTDEAVFTIHPSARNQLVGLRAGGGFGKYLTAARRFESVELEGGALLCCNRSFLRLPNSRRWADRPRLSLPKVCDLTRLETLRLQTHRGIRAVSRCGLYQGAAWFC